MDVAGSNATTLERAFEHPSYWLLLNESAVGTQACFNATGGQSVMQIAASQPVGLSGCASNDNG